MTFTLFPLASSQLRCIADARPPGDLTGRSEPQALPPSFVAARSLALAADGPVEPGSTTFLILREADARFVGACGFKTLPSGGRVEVGYGVSASARGQGAATAALELLAALAFDAGATEVLAEVLPDNAASTRVVRKAGFAVVGSRRDEDDGPVIQWLLRREERATR